MFLERFIEAGWLLSLIVMPLLFDPYANRGIELAKVAAHRSIALTMVLAWIVKALETWRAGHGGGISERGPALGAGPGRRHLWRALSANHLRWLAILFLAACAFSTITSIAPRISLWGSYERFQGLYTTASYLVVFLSIAALLRTREQVDRLVTTALAVSLPVSLYGIIQRSGMDPITWPGVDVSGRVISTMGNPIFVAAFLCMVVPLTLSRLLESERLLAEREGVVRTLVITIGWLLNLILHVAAWALGPTIGTLAAVTTLGIWGVEAWLLRKPLLPFVRVGMYSVVLSIQLACLLFSRSRGPWLGLAAGVVFFTLLWTLVRGKWRSASLASGAGVAVALALLLINLPHSPLAFVRDMPYLGRLGHMFDGAGRVRILIWQGAWQLITANPARTIIGYGPETMRLVYPPYNPPALGRLETRNSVPSRSHNETLDLLITTGLIGLTIYLIFFTSLVYWGVKSLGLIHSPVQRKLFLGLWGIGGLGAVLLAFLVDRSWRFSGLALPIGMLGGMFAYLSAYGRHRFLSREEHDPGRAGSSLRLIVVGVLSAVIAHFIEIQFGIAIEVTRTYFWAYAALLLVAGHQLLGPPGVAAEISASVQVVGRTAPGVMTDTNNRAHRPGGTEGHLPRPPMVASDAARAMTDRRLVSISMIVSFIMVTMVYNFLSLPIARAHLPSILWVFIVTWLSSGLIIVLETWCAEGAAPNLTRALGVCGVYAGMTLVTPLLFAAVHKGILLRVGDVANIPVPYYVSIFLTLVATGALLLLGQPRPARALTGVGGLAGSALAACTLWVILTTNVDLIRADIYHKQARLRFDQSGRHDQAIGPSRRALSLAPSQEFYHLFLGQILLDKGVRAGNSQERDALFLEAEKSLIRANHLSPLDVPSLATLARLYRVRAEQTSDPPQRTARLQQALAFCELATARSPNNVLLWNEWALTLFSLGDEAQARQKLLHSLTLDDTFGPTHQLLGKLSAPSHGPLPQRGRGVR